MTQGELFVTWCLAFGITWVVECAILWPAFARFEPKRIRRVLIITIGQCCTHPIVWFALPLLGLPRAVFFTLAEAWAIGAESLVYFVCLPALGLRRALLWSVLANAASALLGELLRSLTHAF